MQMIGELVMKSSNGLTVREMGVRPEIVNNVHSADSVADFEVVHET